MKLLIKLLYDELVEKANAINTGGLVQKTDYDNKITERKYLVLVS